MRNAFVLLVGAGLAGTAGGSGASPAPWPHAASLNAGVPAPPAAGLRLFLDAGHGAPDNTGNRSAYCEDEEQFTLALVDDVAAALERWSHFEVVTSRSATARPTYAARVDEARRVGADAFVSIHSDIRARGTPWSPSPGLQCLRDRGTPGFSVLYADDGDPVAVAGRRRLAVAIAQAMNERGFGAFLDYAAHYTPDASGLGVFLDRHPARQRIYVLHAPPMPSVIVETHHALDDREVRLWREPHTRRAFAAAIADALSATFPARGPS